MKQISIVFSFRDNSKLLCKNITRSLLIIVILVDMKKNYYNIVCCGALIVNRTIFCYMRRARPSCYRNRVINGVYGKLR